jgi:hypothetical protein
MMSTAINQFLKGFKVVIGSNSSFCGEVQDFEWSYVEQFRANFIYFYVSR